MATCKRSFFIEHKGTYAKEKALAKVKKTGRFAGNGDCDRV
jgi:hypothetical protein